jgi:glycosyltransferase A (GT-A) superfamily protein (DUF2064 family)
MLSGARLLFEEGDEPVIVLGTDAPTLPANRIHEAAEALTGEELYDISIVSSEDGGYVLLGLRAPHEPLFRGIAWSTPGVYEQTLARAREAGLSVYEAEPHRDVDTPEDLERLRRELAADPGLAPCTAAVLESV